MTPGADLRVAVFGAGAIGCFIGGSLLASGNPVVLIGREPLQDDIAKHGLTVSDLDGRERHVSAQRVRYATDLEAVAEGDIVIVSVKSGDTEHAGQQLIRHLKPTATVFSFQNGVGNAETLAGRLDCDVVPAMVPFNVLWRDGAHFHRATSGSVLLGDHPRSRRLREILIRSGVPCDVRTDMDAVLWGKLLVNLNNALNALSDRPLRQQLLDRNYRRVLADCVDEGLAVCAAQGIKPARILRVPPALLPRVLRLPDWLFARIARAMLDMDDQARSSMWDDLRRGRFSEIDYLNGAIARIGKDLGVSTPVNRAVTRLVRDAFERGTSPALTGLELRSRANCLV